MPGGSNDKPAGASGQIYAGHLRPGEWVMHPGQPEWGRGQVQSVVGARVTVNFEQVGKVLVNIQHVTLQPLDD
jgi:hypothetical protein